MIDKVFNQLVFLLMLLLQHMSPMCLRLILPLLIMH